MSVSTPIAKISCGLWLALVATGIVLLSLPSAPRKPMVRPDDWIVDGGFFANGGPSIDDLSTDEVRHRESRFWRSWSPETGAVRGRIVTKPFAPATATLSLPMVGYPAGPGNSIFLQNERTGERREFRLGNLHENWQDYVFRVPDSWTGDRLVFGAESSGRARYVGIGTPFSASVIDRLRVSLPTIVAVHALCFGLLLLLVQPFHAILGRFVGRALPAIRRVGQPIALTLLGFIVFFGCFFAPKWARLALVGLLGVGLLLSGQTLWRLLRHPVSFLTRRPAIAVWFGGSLFAAVFLYAQQTTSLLYVGNYRFTPASWSTDNQIPTSIAGALENGSRLKDFSLGSWQVSDRPPAMVGLSTIARMAGALAFRGTDRWPTLMPIVATVFGICVLATWVLPIWELARSAGLRGRRRMLVTILLAATPFVFFNTIYIWPKLLSGSLVITAWLLLTPHLPGRAGWWAGGVSGLACGLATMAHGSAVFGIVPCGVLLLLNAPRRRFLPLVACGLVFLLTILPWSIWAKQYFPPGNALAKFAFAGTFGWDSREKSVCATVRDAYRKETFSSLASRRVDGLKTWVGLATPVRSPVGWSQEGNDLRRLEFFHIVPALGLLLLPLGALAIRGRGRPRAGSLKAGTPGWLAVLGLSGLGFQLLVMWDNHLLHHYAYSSLLALHASAVFAIAHYGRTLCRVAGLAVILGFLTLWIISPVIDFRSAEWSGFLFSLAVAVGALVMVWRLAGDGPRRRPLQEAPVTAGARPMATTETL